MSAAVEPGDDVTLTVAEKRHVLRRTFAMLAPYRRQVLLIALAVIGQAAMVLAGPILVRIGIDDGIRKGDKGVLTTVSIMYGFAVAMAYLFGRAVILLVARVGESFLVDIRKRVFDRLMEHSMPFYDSNRTGTLVGRMTADIEVLQELVGQGLAVFVFSVLLVAGTVIAMVALSWRLALTLIVILPLLLVVSNWFRVASAHAYLQVRDSVGATLAALQEGLSGTRVIQAFARTDDLSSDFHRASTTQFRTAFDAEKIAALYTGSIEILQGAAIVLVLVFGALFASDGVVTVGIVAAFILYQTNLFEPIHQLVGLFNTVQQSGAALHKLYEVLDAPIDVPEAVDPIQLPPAGSLAMRDVQFAYPGTTRPVLRDINLEIAAGERVVLVGPTGAGKSSLAKLLSRMYDPTTGSVSMGGVDLRDASLASLRERIVVLPQEGFLFEGSVAENIALGRPNATHAEIEAALDRLTVRSRFEAIGGLDAMVRERGANLSAGERQLVGLARAALVDPAVLVLDEATSNLDPGTEFEVEQALERLLEGRTGIVIAHRLSSAERADRVIVCDDGRIIEAGTHAALMEHGGVYAGLFATWADAQVK